MSDELETAAMASAGGLAKKKTSVDSASEEQREACRNCGHPVTRKYCGNCGQLAQNFHRPVLYLITEVLSDFFSLDGRVARTIPAMIFRPGVVTRAYLDGKRQRFVPPFRLYLLSSFLFFLALFALGDAKGWFRFNVDLGPAQQTQAQLVPPEGSIEPAPSDSDLPSSETADSDVAGAQANSASEADPSDEHRPLSRLVTEDGKVEREFIKSRLAADQGDGQQLSEWTEKIVDTTADVYENQAVFLAAIKNWAPRLALGLTPALIVCLLIVFPFRRGVYIYDHVISALHFQTWLYFVSLFGLAMIWLGVDELILLIIPALPFYLYRLIRMVYPSGRILGILRTFFILVLLLVIFCVWILGVIVFSAEETAALS